MRAGRRWPVEAVAAADGAVGQCGAAGWSFPCLLLLVAPVFVIGIVLVIFKLEDSRGYWGRCAIRAAGKGNGNIAHCRT